MTKWTPEAIRALGPTTDLPTLGTIFDCSRWKSYQMARHGEWDRVGIKVISIGSKYRVVVQSILDVLGYGSADLDARAATHASELVRASGSADEQQSTASPDGRPAPRTASSLLITGEPEQCSAAGPSWYGWSASDQACVPTRSLPSHGQTQYPRSSPSERRSK